MRKSGGIPARAAGPSHSIVFRGRRRFSSRRSRSRCVRLGWRKSRAECGHVKTVAEKRGNATAAGFTYAIQERKERPRLGVARLASIDSSRCVEPERRSARRRRPDAEPRRAAPRALDTQLNSNCSMIHLALILQVTIFQPARRDPCDIRPLLAAPSLELSDYRGISREPWPLSSAAMQ